MADKLIPVKYSLVNASVTIPNTSATVDTNTTYTTKVDPLSYAADSGYLVDLNISGGQGLSPDNTFTTQVQQTTHNTSVGYDTRVLVNVSGADETSIPTAGLFRRAIDVSKTSEVFKNLVRKSSLELLSVAEAIKLLASFIRKPQDSFSIAERFTKYVRLQKVSLLSTTTTRQVNLQSRKLDNSSTISSISKSPRKVVNDLIGSISDQNFKRYTKANVDPTYTADYNILVASFIRSFQDTVDATDDYFGNANLDDDQYAYFTKTLAHYANIAAPHSTQISKPFTSTITRSEQYRNLIGKSFVEPANAEEYFLKTGRKGLQTYLAKSDSVSKSQGKQLTESPSRLTDTSILKSSNLGRINTLSTSISTVKILQAKQQEYLAVQEYIVPTAEFIRSFQESGLLTDPSSLTLQKPFTSSVIQTDSTIPQIGKNIVELQTLADTTTFLASFERSLQDFVLATDDYLGEANIDDDQYNMFIKGVLDSAIVDASTVLKSVLITQEQTINTAEEKSFLVQYVLETQPAYLQDTIDFLASIKREFSDTVIITSSGLANNQNYFAETYVAPGYVGTNTYFS